ncbi:MAG: amidohydrolase family protein [Alphaproteobacteria bacterium]|nr:amidohydrolase family protein [Alphaproteobacteria bacterium]MDP6813872.1 amidohydrolase family protein [Alphaproteobacteria bacterium]
MVKPPAARAPTGACDCHAHVFARPGSHYLNPLRGYTPPEASLNDFRAMHRVLGIDRAVIVQPSVYGTDNRCSRQAVEALGDAGRGVAVIDLDTPDDELARLHEAGFRGSRFNVLSGGGVDLTQLEAVAARLAELGWHLQTFIDGAALAELAPRLAALPVEVVVDHLGHPDPELDIDQPGFRALLGLLRDGQAWVKISGAYRVDSGPAPWPAADRFAEALIAAAPDRLVWGSDWPHPALSGPMPNDGDLFDRLLAWTPDEDLRRRILVDNPARLYDFP